MGLTIHYVLSTPRKLSLAGVKRLVASLHEKAIALEFEKPGRLMRVGPDYVCAFHWPQGAKKFSDLLPPLVGWVFHATPGDGCESAQIGLCRYEGVPGWQLESFCKTQYASRHGWEHFLKCHRAVTELLWTAKHIGLQVEVDDEGGYWKTGSNATLRRILAEYDECIAAFGGALKDAAGDSASDIAGAIFAHPDYERLEAQGIAGQAEKVSRAVQVVKRLVDSK